MKFNFKLPDNILEKVGLEGHAKLRVSTFYSKIRVGYWKSIINLQRRLLMSWKLKLNLKRERPFKCIAFQGIFRFCLRISAIAISTNFDSPSDITIFFITYMVVNMLQLRNMWMESSRLLLKIQNQYFVMEKYEKRPKLLFISHGRDLEKILRYLIYRE